MLRSSRWNVKRISFSGTPRQLLRLFERVFFFERLTLQLDVAMDQPNSMHPTDRVTQLGKHPPRQRLRDLGVVIRQEIKQLAPGAIVEHEDRVRPSQERAREGDERRMGNVLFKKRRRV